MKELKIYLGTVVVLALAWHYEQWMDHPIEHLMALPNGGAFGVPGMAHPFVFSFIVYLFISIPRWIFSKKKDTMMFKD